MAVQQPQTPDPSESGAQSHICEVCGYGISLARTTLPQCPMCRSVAWKPVPHLPPRFRREAA